MLQARAAVCGARAACVGKKWCRRPRRLFVEPAARERPTRASAPLCWHCFVGPT